MQLEARWLARGRTLPAGLSLLARAAEPAVPDAHLGGDLRHLQQPRLPAAGDHRAGVDGRPLAGRDGAGARRRARQSAQAADLAGDPDRHRLGDRSATTSATCSGAGSGARCSRRRVRSSITGSAHRRRATSSSRSTATRRCSSAAGSRWCGSPRRGWPASTTCRFTSSSSGTRSAAITWATTFGLAGYFGGDAAAHVITQVGIYGAIALGVAGGRGSWSGGAGAARPTGAERLISHGIG